jgi:hypothetical protein
VPAHRRREGGRGHSAPDPLLGCKERQFPQFVDPKTKKLVTPSDTLCRGRPNMWVIAIRQSTCSLTVQAMGKSISQSLQVCPGRGFVDRVRDA